MARNMASHVATPFPISVVLFSLSFMFSGEELSLRVLMGMKSGTASWGVARLSWVGSYGSHG
ncbi:hypothetical protein TSUD_390270 [Trifolium subterraneum]|uniref:Uncharacterized protein n=1 Tax=Trifolium subterraneum TaxID=3900 RepID=A0A2Z6NF86_TRISU|nr:hypothetical protein TSUD_390270 [Trifolium subterraneum]